MFAVNKDYNSYFKVVKPEVELSFEGYEDASKVAGILMKQGYVVTMYRDDPGMDVYCLYATYVGDNGYDFERMAAFIDTSTEMAGLRQHDDVFPDDAEQLKDDKDDSDSDNNPEKWDDADEDDDIDYYELGYADGEFDRNNGNNYDNTRYDDDEYFRGYEDGWDDTEDYLAAELGEDEGDKNKDSLDYDVGYSDGQFDYYHDNNYNDGRCESDEYVYGYADGWDAAADEDKPPVYDFDDDDVEETDGWMRIN